jgi:hypothetical protein
VAFSFHRKPFRRFQVHLSTTPTLLELSLNTPALLFPALTLIMLAYTNRFLAIGNLIRNLYKEYEKEQDESRLSQIRNLKHRLRLIRDMQVLGVLSLTSCVVCMGLIFFHFQVPAKIVFAMSLALLAGSLIISTYETFISTKALNIQLHSLEEGEVKGKGFPGKNFFS